MKKNLYPILLLPLLIFFFHTSSAYNWIRDTAAGSHSWCPPIMSANGNTIVAFSYSTPVMVSVNGGVTWTTEADTSAAGHQFLHAAGSADARIILATDISSGHPFVNISKNGGTTWRKDTSMHANPWTGAAISADGSRMVVVTSYRLYTSTDTGATWTLQAAGMHTWRSVASSADGMKLVAGATSDYIFTSTDGGVTWTQQTAAGLHTWYCLSCSSDGMSIVGTTDAGTVMRSNDGGVTWNVIKSGLSTSLSWVVSSSDGSRLTSCGQSNQIYTTRDSGATWTTEPVAVQYWDFLASSADGKKIVVTSTYDLYLNALPPSPFFGAGHSLAKTVCENATSVTIDTILKAIDTNAGHTITWSLLSPPAHGSASVSYSLISTGDTVFPVGTSYTPVPGYYGYDTFKVRVTNGTNSDTATVYVTVRSFPPVIVGSSSVCTGATITLTDWNTGGTWTSSNSSATVSGGVVTGVAAGVDTITHSFTNSCGSATATKIVTVNPTPTAITGATSICYGYSSTLSDAVPGGVWTSGAPTIASIGSATGILTFVTPGPAVITYTLPGGCSTSTYAYCIPSGPPASIIGCDNIGVGDTLRFPQTMGGMLVSSNYAVAQPAYWAGAVVGVSVGTANISIYNRGSCLEATRTVSVTATTHTQPITGTFIVCEGGHVSVSDPVPGGIWSSSTPSIATIGSAGIVTGLSAGETILSYSIGTYTCTMPFIVNSNPHPITGPANVCVGDTVTLTSGNGLWEVTSIYDDWYGLWPIPIDGPPDYGGRFTSSDTTRAKVYNYYYYYPGSAADITGIAPGTSVITYTDLNTGCYISRTETVNPITPLPAISGPSAVCLGASITLTDSLSGGTWSTSGAHTTVSGGIVTGTSAGTDTIRYSFAGACGTAMVIKIVTVNTMPSAGTITGPGSVCAGSVITLTDASPGGVWTVTNSNATVSGGIVTGVTGGIDTIVYTVANACGSATTRKTVTVNPLPSAGTISGSSSVCIGGTITLTDAVSGGTWSCSNSFATVAGGVVTGVSAGVDTVMYSVSNACGTTVATKVVTVNTMPVAGTITGPTDVCMGASITLTDAVTGGIWTSSNPHATVSSAGVVTGVTPGVDTIYYTVSNACGSSAASKMVNVNPLPLAGTISGPSSVCAGATIALTDGIPGGVWSSSGTLIATVGSGSGIVTGVSAGSIVISYSVSNICGTVASLHLVTVDPLPSAGIITGPSVVCLGATITLTDAITGGVWSCSNSHATIAGGVVTGITAGIDTITYTVTTACGTAGTLHVVTINPLPVAGTVTGPSAVCVGGTIALSDAVTGGSWSSGDPARATVGVSTGIVTGMSAGAVTITYTISGSCGSALATYSLTVNAFPVPGTISGPSAVCVGSPITLTTTVPGGTWHSSNPHATVTSGTVSGVSAGADTISYSISNTCGTASVSHIVTVNPLPMVYGITGGGAYCFGSTGVHIGLSGSDASAAYQLHSGTSTIGAPLPGTGSGLDFGLFTTPGTYFIVATDMSTLCSNTMLGTDTITLVPVTSPTVTITASPGTHIMPGVSDTFTALVSGGGSAPVYQWYVNALPITGATNSTFISSTLYAGDTVSCTVLGSVACSTPGSRHVIISFIGLGVTETNNEIKLIVYPNPNQGTFSLNLISPVDEPMRIVVNNLLGEKVLELNGVTNAVREIQLAQPPGVYLVSVQTAAGTYETRIVVVR